MNSTDKKTNNKMDNHSDNPSDIKLALSDDFLGAFSKLPVAVRDKVSRFIQQFRDNPGSPGINYEKIRNTHDGNLYSVRIDKAHRGILAESGRGNVYLLLWVDKHDDAYQWAQKRVCRVNSNTGGIQIYESLRGEPGSAGDGTGVAGAAAETVGLFADYRDRDLLRWGVPEDLLPLVREIRNEEDLDRLSHRFPAEVGEALYGLASGCSEAEIYDSLERSLTEEKPTETVDTDDYLAALENSDSKRRFYVVENEMELQAILNAPLEKWRVFLHPTQAGLVERDWNGPVRVTGGAGTGKTVVALHRARWLALKRFTDKNQRILFTTFTSNLAADIRENLKKICPVEAWKRIEVVNLDQWVVNFLRGRDYNYKILYDFKTRNELWEDALTLAPPDCGLPPAFYREEWEKVIQPNGITGTDQYFKVSRVGRGTKLGRKLKKAIWPVFEEYRYLLNERGLKEREDALRDAVALLGEGAGQPYSAVVVDEAQDMGEAAFRLIRLLAPREDANNLFIVGDPHQRIYKAGVTLSRCGIETRGRSRYLRINYRTTEETRKWAAAVLEGVHFDDLDGGEGTQRGYRSLLHGSPPEVKGFDDFSGQMEYIKDYIGKQTASGLRVSDICLVVRTREDLERCKAYLESVGVSTYILKRSTAEDRERDGVRLATMHRVKGLEFEVVVIAGAGADQMPLRSLLEETEDVVVKRELEQMERSLLYVSATRARRRVLVTYRGEPSSYLAN